TRGSGLSPSASSSGGTALATRLTRPSAGDTTSRSAVGVTRGGSRKKYAHHNISTVPSQPSGVHTQNRIRLASANAPMNGYPSGLMGESCERMEFTTDISFDDHRSCGTLLSPRGRGWRAKRAGRVGVQYA